MEIAGLMKIGKIQDFEWFLSTKLDFESKFALQIARQALETMLLSKLEEKDEKFFYLSRCNTRLMCARWKTRILCRSRKDILRSAL